MKDYGEASCSGASAEPIKDTDPSDPLPEFETRIKEREFVDVSVITRSGILLVRRKEFYTGSHNQPLCSIRKSIPAPLVASFEKPCRETAEEFLSRFSQQ